jgi:hypothetical protein
MDYTLEQLINFTSDFEFAQWLAAEFSIIWVVTDDSYHFRENIFLLSFLPIWLPNYRLENTRFSLSQQAAMFS